MKYTGIVIADLHIGAMNLETFHKEFNEVLINKIKEMKSLDFLIIAGDYFDHKFYLNDRESTFAYLMLNELIEVCKEKNTVIRIVYGTESHECNQYDILNMIKLYDKIKVVKYVEEEELLPDLNILYLPEEHIISKKEYYKDYFKNINKYNYIFGHGALCEVMGTLSKHLDTSDDSKSKRKKVPVFTTSELDKICKGQVFFGHYHINQNIDDKFYSIGSFSRWKFGEEGQKGFYILKCDTEKDKYKAEYQENYLAQTYTTISYGYDNKAFENEDNMNNALTHIDKLLNDDIFDNVRFIFNIPTNIENPESTINHLKEKFKFNDKVKLEIQHGYIEEKRERQKKETNIENEKYSFIFDKSLELEDKVCRFISIEYNKDIPTENVHKYINLPLNDILEIE